MEIEISGISTHVGLEFSAQAPSPVIENAGGSVLGAPGMEADAHEVLPHRPRSEQAGMWIQKLALFDMARL